MGLVTQAFAVDGERRYVAALVIYHDDALARHCDIFGRREAVRRLERSQEITEGGVDEYRAVCNTEHSCAKITNVL